MKIHSLLSIVPLLLAVCEAGLFGSSKEPEIEDAPLFRYDYKLAFKKPYYYNDSVPFWETGGDVIKADDFIRLSLSVPNSKGYIWSKIPNPHEEWETEIHFRVSGSHLHGGRGMAFWYAKEPMVEGPVFGSKDKWDGLSVWLDSANPVTHKPSIMAIINQGNLAFAAGDDPTKHNLGSCSSTYRNAPGESLLKVKYVDKTLTVSIGTGEAGGEYRICLQKSGVSLPKGYYFGMSAASHNPADDHDIISLETRQLNPPQKKEHHKRPLEDQKIKAGQEYSGIADEQKERIEEAEFQMRRLRESAEENQGSGETALTMV
ncbi:hypothetical protein K501DRAFT_37597 [Backusella circina FSU 941]|nr:hypothetical protein K501DRAFT_37597 [Backusella circina FSU 941]